MEKVAYVLGAGFSAPTGIPVTSGFMEAAEDLLESGDKEVTYFREVIERAKQVASIKTYVSSDLLNLEEVLSILEMMADLRGEERSDVFVRFLCDVIRKTSPDWHPFAGSLASNWYDQMWGRGSLVHPYGDFVGSLLGLGLRGSPRSPRVVDSFGHTQARYAVITFNYDRVLESLCENAADFFGESDAVAFRKGFIPLTH